MSWLKWILAYLFDCVHPHTTWPHRDRVGLAYVCCIDCGRELPYSVQQMKIAPDKNNSKTSPRNEAPLNCVSLRSQLNCEVTRGVFKGQDERRPSAAPLTAPQVTPELLCSTEENKQGFTARRNKTGGATGSTELPVVAPARS